MEEILWAGYYVAALINALFLLKAYRRGTSIGKKLGVSMLMNFLMILTYSLCMQVDSLVCKSFGCSFTFLLTDVMIFYYLNFTISFIGWDKTFPLWLKECFIIYLVADGVFMLINPFTNITVSYSQIPFGANYVLGYIPEIPFHLHSIYNFLMIATTIIILLIKCQQSPKIYLYRYYGPIGGMLFAVVIYWIYLTGIIPMSTDPTPLMYVLVGLLLYFFTFNYLPTVTIGITRDMILKYLRDPIILFDYEGKLVDYSENMKKLMPDYNFGVNGELTLDQFVKDQKFTGLSDKNINQEFDWCYNDNGTMRTMQCSFGCMRDRSDKLIGKLFVFHDVTNSRNAYFELENSMLFDGVTGFYNKQSFYTQIPQWSDPDYWPTSFAVCNVDGMRGINEAYGTEYGDEIMRQMAYYIRSHVGEKSYCAKLDNGDLVVVLEKTSNIDASDIMENIKSEIVDHFQNALVSVDYGIATKEDASGSVEKYLQDARASMQNKKMLKDKSASSSLVDSLKQTLSESDFQTEEHVERTRRMCARLGREMGLTDSDIGKLELLAVLHDIGKVAIPQDIIKKKGKLTPDERKIIEQHTVKGYRIAKSSPELGEIAEGILCHHEHWDGTGYPKGLKGEEIPLIARVISAVDSHDVMVNDRPYHKAMPEADAIAELRRCSGTQFDPHVVEVFTALLEREDLPRELEQSALDEAL